MDMRRFLPIMLIAFAALFILPQLFKGGGSKTLSSKDRGTLTRDAIHRIDQAEQKAFAAGPGSTPTTSPTSSRRQGARPRADHPADLDLTSSGTGKSYVVARLQRLLSVARARSGPTRRRQQLPGAEVAVRLQVPGTADGDHHDDREVTTRRAGGSSGARRTSSPPPTPARSAAAGSRR